MDLQEVMRQKTFAVVGDTLNESKYAHRIKHGLIDKGYTVYSVPKELKSLNDIEGEVDIIDMVINPPAGLALLKESTKIPKTVVLQPGAESDAIKEFLTEKGIPYIEGCLLVGLSLYT